MPAAKHDKPSGKLSRELQSIRKKVDNLDIPKSIYVGAFISKKHTQLAEVGAEKTIAHQHPKLQESEQLMLSEWFRKHAKDKNYKYIASSLTGKKNLEKLASKLWMDEDITPYLVSGKKKDVKKLARFAADQFVDGVSKVNVSEENEVEISFLTTLKEYEKVAKKERFDQLVNLAKRFKGKRMMFFSATPRGGGVALMRHALIRLFRLLGVKVSWYVMEERQEVFDITKTKFHNVLHGVSGPDVELTDEDKKLYESWIEENVEMLKDRFAQTDVVIIDDPQPSGLVPHIRKINPDVKIIYRSHIQLETHLIRTPGTPQHNTWQYIWKNIKTCDLFISHPMERFVPDEVSKEKVVYMPATTDRLDGLNKPLSKRDKNYYLKIFDKILLEGGMTPLDKERPYIIQIARFDPSKGINDVLASYKILRKKCEGMDKDKIPQLVIVGNSSIDDPDGVPIFNLTMEMINKDHKKYADDIKVARLPHIDQLLNTLLRESYFSLQLSHREGFEVKVSESLMKEVPIIAYKAGGIPLQVDDGKSGFLVEVGNTRKVAEKMCSLVNDKKLYEKMKKQAKERVHSDVNTVSNAINWLFLANELARNGGYKGNGKYIKDLIK